MAKMRWLKWLWVPAVVLVLLGLLCLPTSFWVWVLDKSDKLRNLFLIVAGVVGAVFIYWRTSIASTDAETKKQNGINNMYTIAIEQLGKEHGENRPNLEVRIGALYSLEKLAQANPDYRQSIMDVLCSYVRNNAPLPRNRESPEESEYASQNKDKPRTDIQTVLTIIGRSNIESGGSRQRINLSYCYLAGAALYGAHLAGASFEGADLEGADLAGADLAGADLGTVNLKEAELGEAALHAAALYGADLRMADLRAADLWTTDLQAVDLQGADLRACLNFERKQLQSAKNWQMAYRDSAFACGAEIPDPSEKDNKADWWTY